MQNPRWLSFDQTDESMAASAFQSPAQSSPLPTSPYTSVAAADYPLKPSSLLSPAVQAAGQHHSLSLGNYDESTATEERNECTDDETTRLDGETVSSRSSISSLPASVASSVMAFPPDAVTPTRSPKLHERRVGSLSSQVDRQKWRNSPFRNPSSVRSMQMRDEDDIAPPHPKRSSRTSRDVSTFSAMSPGSTPQAKRQRHRTDSQTSPKYARVKREFPLVLLHCSLLPPTMPIKAKTLDTALLQAVLPEAYWRRWELLTDKITYDQEIQSRGVLIPHPRGDYELLEERLLESLELAKPRLRFGHYYGHEDVDEVEESESEAETAVQGTKCQDCGKRLVQDIARDQKWEVKVYAANGLMRAGAWSAAWNEMEKVDIEVSVYLPEDVRREVEERCLHLRDGLDIEAEELQEPEPEPSDAESRRREIYGSPEGDLQEPADSLFEASHLYAEGHHEHFAPHHQHQQRSSAPAIELKQLMIVYANALAQDKRNTVIAILGLVVLFCAFSISGPSRQATDQNTMPINASEPSLQAGPQCRGPLIPSVSPVLFVPSSASTATPKGLATTSERGGPMKSVGAASVDLQVSLLDERPVTPGVSE